VKSSSELFDAINSLEARFPVSQWRAGDIDLWPTYRFRLYGLAMDSVLQNEAVAPRRRIQALAARSARALLRAPQAALRDWRRNAPVRAGTTAVFLSDGVSFVRLGDAWFDRVIDPVMQALAERGHHSLKLTPLSEVHVPRRWPSRFVQPVIDCVKVAATWRRVDVELPQFGEFHEAARELFGVGVPSSDWLRIQAARLEALAKWFGQIMERSGATHAFVNTYYSLEGLAFIRAARRRGLQSVDLQHGMQGPHHVAYGRWASVPPCGYSTLPDEFWVWGKEESSAIDAWRLACNTHIPRVSGNFWLQHWCDDSDPQVACYVERARMLRGPGSQVLVCLSWGVPEEETRKLVEAAKLCGRSVGWWWRLHPVMARHSREFARFLELHGLNGGQVQEATDLPLFALLRAADVTVAPSSTVIQEAAEFGVPSVVTSNWGAEMHRGLVQRGMVQHATDAPAIAAAVTALTAGARPAPAPKVGSGQSLGELVAASLAYYPDLRRAG
jgi:hypothetical protein